jgi:hypothetical protein
MQKLTWPAVGLIAVLAGVAVALATLSDWESAEIIAVVSILAGIGGGAAVVGGVSGRVEQLQAETSAQTQTLDTVAHRVNGELDGRIAAGADRAAERVLGVLRDQGVIR